SSTRLVTRNAISLVFPLPITYEDRIRQVPGVRMVSRVNWFGGIYIDKRNFFPQFAVDGREYLELYPEYRIRPEQVKAFLLDRKGCVVGSKLADTYGWKLGDVIPIRGTIFPGNWEFVVRAIFDGADAGTNDSQLFFHWDYLNESLKKTAPRRANQVGVFVLGISDPDAAAQTSRAVDAMFKNSLAETLTETEKAFQLGFFSMTEAIVVAIRIVSLVIIVIIMAVMANTMAMAARERVSEYATLKALGFRPSFLGGLMLGESMFIALAAGALGMLFTVPLVHMFGNAMAKLFPVFQLSAHTLVLQLAAVALVGAVAAVVPSWRASRVVIARGLRAIG
ncbi:MAG TPA: ABC transporter permease, partial [Burkholderiales bacterium]|nr:ABC transporter permease [Burkholderiales bacterium]